MGGWGVSGGEARGPSWRERIRGVEGENKSGGGGEGWRGRIRGVEQGG